MKVRVYLSVDVDVPQEYVSDPGGYALAHYDPDAIDYEFWDFVEEGER